MWVYEGCEAAYTTQRVARRRICVRGTCLMRYAGLQQMPAATPIVFLTKSQATSLSPGALRCNMHEGHYGGFLPPKHVTCVLSSSAMHAQAQLMCP